LKKPDSAGVAIMDLALKAERSIWLHFVKAVEQLRERNMPDWKLELLAALAA